MPQEHVQNTILIGVVLPRLQMKTEQISPLVEAYVQTRPNMEGDGRWTDLWTQHGGRICDCHHDFVDQLHRNVSHHTDPLGILQC